MKTVELIDEIVKICWLLVAAFLIVWAVWVVNYTERKYAMLINDVRESKNSVIAIEKSQDSHDILMKSIIDSIHAKR